MFHRRYCIVRRVYTYKEGEERREGKRCKTAKREQNYFASVMARMYPIKQEGRSSGPSIVRKQRRSTKFSPQHAKPRKFLKLLSLSVRGGKKLLTFINDRPASGAIYEKTSFFISLNSATTRTSGSVGTPDRDMGKTIYRCNGNRLIHFSPSFLKLSFIRKTLKSQQKTEISDRIKFYPRNIKHPDIVDSLWFTKRRGLFCR